MMEELIASKSRRVHQRAIAAVCIGLLLLAIAFMFIVTITSKSYFDKHYEARNPVWVTDIFLKGRLLLGRFRPAPSNDEMIRFFQAHQEAFDHLINEYYEQLRIFYEYKPGGDRRFPDINEKLRVQMAALGISKIDAVGPFYMNSMHGRNPIETLGVQFLLMDRAGLSDENDQAKLYVYAPRVSDQASLKKPPIFNFFNTGEYGPSTSIPAFCSRHDTQCCGLQIFSNNWAIANCIHSAIK